MFKAQPYRNFKGSVTLLLRFFEVCEIQGATLWNFRGVSVTFTSFFLWLVEFKVQPYRALKVSGSLFSSLFEVCGVQGATLSQFPGVGDTFTLFF